MTPPKPNAAIGPEEQLNEIGKGILFLLEKSPQLELTELASELHVPFAMACMAVGWLIRSRVLTLVGATADKWSVQFRGLLK
jgi:hypothetical protein